MKMVLLIVVDAFGVVDGQASALIDRTIRVKTINPKSAYNKYLTDQPTS